MTARGTSIRLRLTAWYFLSVALVLVLIAAGSWFAMRASVYTAVDLGLQHALGGVAPLVASQRDGDAADLRTTLDRASRLMLAGGLFQVFDEHGVLLYQSAGLARHRVTTSPPPPPAAAPDAQGESRDRRRSRRGPRPGADIVFRSIGPDTWPVRMASVRVRAGDVVRTVEVGEPLQSFNESLRRFAWLLVLSVPVLLLVATALGYWIAGRALAPVDGIIRDARALDPDNLSARLTVPPAHDELRQLSETLNDMLARIEGSVSRTRQFTADASHELRGPLALIQAAAEYAVRRERPREALVDALQTVLRESKRTTALVDSLLALARGDADQDAGALMSADMTRIVRDVVDAARPLAADTNVTLAADIAEAPLMVLADPVLLQRVVFILIDNALKYTLAGGRVDVRVTPADAHVVLAVTDTGIGIAPDDLPRVFDRFWRADTTRSRGAGGVGLGLSIAHDIVRRAGGALDAESTPGVGLTFRVSLRAADTDDNTALRQP